jgi:transcriptional regulator GlxA family with amidase domain
VERVRYNFDADHNDCAVVGLLKDGAIWTSAGVTAGIDMALALIEEDHGQALAAQIARNLVVYLRRPGG